jgi:hypothetical protein
MSRADLFTKIRPPASSSTAETSTRPCTTRARRQRIAGWQFDNRVELLRGEDAVDAAHPTHFIGLLRDLCERRPELEVYLLEWSPSFLFALSASRFRAFPRAGPSPLGESSPRVKTSDETSMLVAHARRMTQSGRSSEIESEVVG